MSKTWAFMERFEIPDLDNPERLYLTRLRIVATPWFGVYLHRLDGPDSRPTLHDHPWSFVSLILRGGYVERRLNLHDRWVETHTRRLLNVMRRGDAHYIRELLRVPTWTLLLVGRRRRTWGYLEPMTAGGWIWTPFDRHEHATEFDAAMRVREMRKRGVLRHE